MRLGVLLQLTGTCHQKVNVVRTTVRTRRHQMRVGSQATRYQAISFASLKLKAIGYACRESGVIAHRPFWPWPIFPAGTLWALNPCGVICQYLHWSSLLTVMSSCERMLCHSRIMKNCPQRTWFFNRAIAVCKALNESLHTVLTRRIRGMQQFCGHHILPSVRFHHP